MFTALVGNQCWNYYGLHDHMKLISTTLKVHDQSYESNVFTFLILHIQCMGKIKYICYMVFGKYKVS